MQSAVACLVVLCALVLSGCQGFRNGSIVDQFPVACSYMLPYGHVNPMDNNKPFRTSTETSPYTITASKSTFKSGDKIDVSIQIKSGVAELDPLPWDNRTVDIDFFLGIFLQARVVKCKDGKTTETYAGSFTTNNANLRVSDCAKGLSKSQNTVVHKNTPGITDPALAVKHRAGTVAQWTAQSGLDGDIKFVATIVARYDTFWVKLESGLIKNTDKPCVGGAPALTTSLLLTLTALVTSLS